MFEVAILNIKYNMTSSNMEFEPIVEALLSLWDHAKSHDDRAISVGAQHQWFPDQQLILDELHEIRLRVDYDLD